MQDFRRLEVWQAARALRLEVYRLTRSFPDDERWVLVPQIRRSASSIGWNIAEGSARGSDADFARCLQIAAGSVAECHDQLIHARDLGYLSDEEFRDIEAQVSSLARRLNALLRYLRNRASRTRTPRVTR